MQARTGGDMETARAVRPWGIAASVAVCIAALVRGFVLVSSAQAFATVGRTMGGAAGIERIQTAIIGVLVATALVLGAGVVVLRWLYVARANAERLPGPSPRWAREWAVGAWFVPLANLVLVPLVVTDVWRSSGKARREPVEIALWWTSVLVAAALNLAANLTRAGGGELVATGLQIFGAVMEVVAGGLLILVVLRISTWQDEASGREDPPGGAPTSTAVNLAALPDETPAPARTPDCATGTRDRIQLPEATTASSATGTAWPSWRTVSVSVIALAAIVLVGSIVLSSRDADRAPVVVTTLTLVPPGSSIGRSLGRPAVAPDGRSAFVPLRDAADVNAAALIAVDGLGSSALRFGVSIPLSGSTGAPVFSRDGRQVLVPHGDGVGVVDAALRRVTSVIPGMQNASRIAVAAAADRAVVSDDEGMLWLLDTTTDTVLDAIPVGDESQGLAVSADGRRVLLGRAIGHMLGAVEVYDMVERRTISTIPVGWYPSSIAFASDDRTAFVTNVVDGDVTVINTASSAVIGTAPGCPGADNANTHPPLDIVDVSCSGLLPTGALGEEILGLDYRSGAIASRTTIPGIHPVSAAHLDGSRSLISDAQSLFIVSR